MPFLRWFTAASTSIGLGARPGDTAGAGSGVARGAPLHRAQPGKRPRLCGADGGAVPSPRGDGGLRRRREGDRAEQVRHAGPGRVRRPADPGRAKSTRAWRCCGEPASSARSGRRGSTSTCSWAPICGGDLKEAAYQAGQITADNYSSAHLARALLAARSRRHRTGPAGCSTGWSALQPGWRDDPRGELAKLSPNPQVVDRLARDLAKAGLCSRAAPAARRSGRLLFARRNFGPCSPALLQVASDPDPARPEPPRPFEGTSLMSEMAMTN